MGDWPYVISCWNRAQWCGGVGGGVKSYGERMTQIKVLPRCPCPVSHLPWWFLSDRHWADRYVPVVSGWGGGRSVLF